MKVLIVYPNFYVYGGGEVLVVRLCNYLTSQGVENAILTMNMLPEVQKDLQNTKVHVVEQRPTSISTLWMLCREVRRLSADYDVINPHNYPAELTAISSHKPSVWMCNEPELHLSIANEKHRLKTRAYLKTLAPCEKYIVRHHTAQCVVADSANSDRFKKIYKRLPLVINYGIDAEFFSRGDKRTARAKCGIGDEFVVLHVGMLTKFKNQLESLRALNVLKGTVPSIRLVLAGFWHDEYKKEIDSYIFDNGLGRYVTMTGHIKKSELRDWYHAADVLIHPIGPQGGWLSPFEALSAGTPIVVSRKMSASDMISDNKIGTVTDDYAGSILKIYKEYDGFATQASNGAKWVAANLSWDNYGKQMLEVFRTVANS